jgi:hypothetical protein
MTLSHILAELVLNTPADRIPASSHDAARIIEAVKTFSGVSCVKTFFRACGVRARGVRP